jgi:hypothetical protein
LTDQGIEVLPVFERNGYALGKEALVYGSLDDQIAPYIATVGREFADLFTAVRLRWPSNTVRFLCQTMVLEQVLALVRLFAKAQRMNHRYSMFC